MFFLLSKATTNFIVKLCLNLGEHIFMGCVKDISWKLVLPKINIIYIYITKELEKYEVLPFYVKRIEIFSSATSKLRTN